MPQIKILLTTALNNTVSSPYKDTGRKIPTFSQGVEKIEVHPRNKINRGVKIHKRWLEFR